MRVRFAILDHVFLRESSPEDRREYAARLAPSLRWMLFQSLAEIHASDHSYASVQGFDESRILERPAGRASSSAGWRLSTSSPVTASSGAVQARHHGSAILSSPADEDDYEYLDRARAVERFNAAGSDLARAWVVVEYRRELLSLRIDTKRRNAAPVTPVSSLQRLFESQVGGRTALVALVSTVGRGREADPALKLLACRRYEHGDSFKAIARALSIDGLTVNERTPRRWWADYLRDLNGQMSAF